MIDGAILAKALYPQAAKEIDRILLRGEIYKIVFISLIIVLALIFGHK